MSLNKEIDALTREHDKLEDEMKDIIHGKDIGIWELEYGDEYSHFRELRKKKGVTINKISVFYREHSVDEVIKEMRDENDRIIREIRKM